MNELEQNIRNWARERGIYQHSTPKAQLLKAVSEIGELADAEVKDNPWEALDAVGDVVVCLINYCAMKDFTLEYALQCAWNEIKDRKGRMVPGGVFLKEEG